MPYHINTITKDQWKTMRKDAGVEKTPWYKGSGPSVASKLEAWQAARDSAKGIKKAMTGGTYVFSGTDDKIIYKAFAALDDLEKALKQMLAKIKAQKLRTEALNEFQKEVELLIQQAEKKLPKWAAAAKSAKEMALEAVKKSLNEALNL